MSRLWIVILTTASLAAPLLASAEVAVPFRFDPPDSSPGQVSVAGEWNQWNAGVDLLSDEDGDGLFEGTILIEPGRYEYKFVVDGNWYEDPEAAESVPNPYGSSNSVVYVSVEEGAAKEYRIGPQATEPASSIREVTFSFHPEQTPAQVFLAGTFNEWNPTADRMGGPDDDGVFTLSMPLPPGEHQYKFVADGVWHHDPNGENQTADGFGGFNSIIRVDDRFPPVSLAEGDGRIYGADLDLSPGNVSVVRVDPERIIVTARAYQGDVEGASILFLQRGEERSEPMVPIGGDGRHVYFRGEMEAGIGTEGRLGVRLYDGDSIRVMTRRGLMTEAESAVLLEISAVTTPLFSMPDWVVDGVFYQIFPERFRNGNRQNDPDFSESYYRGKTSLPEGGKTNGEYYHLVRDWSDAEGLTRSPYRTDGRPDYFSFYGGDLEGVTEKLSYLKDLGVTIIYFNPVHRAKSSHKYDACHYREVDPHFGGNAAFRRLTEKAHEAGIRVIVDGVFNHTGDCHYAFRDCLEKGQDSPYWKWYEWRKWPLPDPLPEGAKATDYYDCWWGHGTLPNLNFDLSRPGPREEEANRISEAEPNWPVIEEVMETVRFWLVEMDADGFRLDVAGEVPDWFWRLFREEVRNTKPDAYVIAELWGNAAADLSPLRFDATMNYKYFREPALAFFGRGQIDAPTFDMQLVGGRYGYPVPSVLGAMNLLGSHDTERFLTLAGGDERRLLLAMLFGATYVGVPHIYYGDEIGMQGGPDPDCRRPFPWGTLDEPAKSALRSQVREYLAARRAHPALRRGEFHTLLAEEQIFAFARWTEEDRLVVLLNAGYLPAEITLERGALPFEAGEAEDVLGGRALPFQGEELRIHLEPFAGSVLAFPAP